MPTTNAPFAQRLATLPGPVRLAMLGTGSGLLSAWLPGPPLHFGQGAWAVDLLMVLAGLWFGAVVAVIAFWRAGASLWAALACIAATWVAWEIAVNVAIMTGEGWLKSWGLAVDLRYAIAGALAGMAGAGLTWGAAAALTGRLANLRGATLVAATGAAFGTLLALANAVDAPLALFVPWQVAVAWSLGYALAGGR